MIKGTGEGRGGFTLIEIVVVMAIIVTLFSLVVVSAGYYISKGYEKATISLIHQLQQHLDNYKERTGEYPPDGFDSPQKNDQGTLIKGAACLQFFLSQPIVEKKKVAGSVQARAWPPIVEFKESELSKEDPEFPGAREIIDGWGNPIHYDNTADGKFTAQTGDAHTPPVDEADHPDDPRLGDFIVEGKNAVPKAGAVQGHGFDLWSHAEQGHDGKKPKAMPIASWNLKE